MRKRQRFRLNYDTIGRGDWRLVIGRRVRLTRHVRLTAPTETKIDLYHRCAYLTGVGRIAYNRHTTIIAP